MSISIHEEHGYIIGGVADRRMHQQAKRESGAKAAAHYYIEKGHLIHLDGGWYFWATLSKRKMNWRELADLIGDGDREVGWYRFEDLLIPAMLKRTRKSGEQIAFRKKTFWLWVEGIAAFDFTWNGLVQSNNQKAYKARLKNGELD